MDDEAPTPEEVVEWLREQVKQQSCLEIQSKYYATPDRKIAQKWINHAAFIIESLQADNQTQAEWSEELEKENAEMKDYIGEEQSHS